jgi:hypothetical protein
MICAYRYCCCSGTYAMRSRRSEYYVNHYREKGKNKDRKDYATSNTIFLIRNSNLSSFQRNLYPWEPHPSGVHCTRSTSRPIPAVISRWRVRNEKKTQWEKHRFSPVFHDLRATITRATHISTIRVCTHFSLFSTPLNGRFVLINLDAQGTDQTPYRKHIFNDVHGSNSTAVPHRENSLWQFVMAGIRNANGSAVLCNGSSGLAKWVDKNGRWPNANAWNCCCCPASKTNTHAVINHQNHINNNDNI